MPERPGMNLLFGHPDRVRIDYVDGSTRTIEWESYLDPIDRQKASLIVVDRMPQTFEENAWFWYGLSALLAPGASIKMGVV